MHQLPVLPCCSHKQTQLLLVAAALHGVRQSGGDGDSYRSFQPCTARTDAAKGHVAKHGTAHIHSTGQLQLDELDHHHNHHHNCNRGNQANTLIHNFPPLDPSGRCTATAQARSIASHSTARHSTGNADPSPTQQTQTDRHERQTTVWHLLLTPAAVMQHSTAQRVV